MLQKSVDAAGRACVNVVDPIHPHEHRLASVGHNEPCQEVTDWESVLALDTLIALE